MTLRLKLTKDCFAIVISTYAPTMTNPYDIKEAFYEDLNRVLSEVSSKDKLIIFGDFNARVGVDHSSWPNVLGRHGTGKCNSNGLMLLSLCTQYELCITNTIFQQADKFKNTWMHPRSWQWHMFDYAIVRQRDRRDVQITRCMRGADCWSDHRLVRSKMNIQLAWKKKTTRDKPLRKLNIARLIPNKEALQRSLQESLSNIEQEHDGMEEEWRSFQEAVYSAAADTLGFVKRKHRDWFDENEEDIKKLTDKLHKAHKDHLDNKTRSKKKQDYQQVRQLLQQKLRKMKNDWWEMKAEELQAAVDNHDMKTFHDGLRTFYGLKASGSTTVRSSDQSTLLTKKTDILARWAEHFSSVLNRESTISDEAIASLPQLPVRESLADPRTSAELAKALKQTTPGKAPGADGMPADIYKNGGDVLLEQLTSLFRSIWEAWQVPQDSKDASIVHIYKREGDKAFCDNHRGISLLCIAGKILARVILNRLITHIADSIIPESQCGLCAGRGTCDMVFAVRQLQEKCREQNQELHRVIVDLTKAFDTVKPERPVEDPAEVWMSRQAYSTDSLLPRRHASQSPRKRWRPGSLPGEQRSEAGLRSRPDFVLHPVCSDVARRLQRLRQRSVHPVSHWWETLQPAKTPCQDQSVRGHPTGVPLRRRLCTGWTLSRRHTVHHGTFRSCLQTIRTDDQPWKDWSHVSALTITGCQCTTTSSHRHQQHSDQDMWTSSVIWEAPLRAVDPWTLRWCNALERQVRLSADWQRDFGKTTASASPPRLPCTELWSCARFCIAARRVIPMQHLWPLVCVTNWSSFPHEDPPRQMTCLPTHLSYRQENPLIIYRQELGFNL